MTNILGKLSAILLVLLTFSCTSEQIEPKTDCSDSTLEVTINNITDANCGEENGSVVLLASGGVEPYTFTLDGGQNQVGSFSRLAAGNYVASVVDSLGCTATTDVAIKNEAGVNLDQLVTTDASCGGSEGSIEVQASDGVEPFEYSLNGGAFQASNLFSSLSKGDYTVSVRDASDCKTSESVSLLTGVSYENSIKSIIASNCAISGCHNGSISPNLSEFSGIQARAERIKIRTGNRSMPQGRNLTQTEIDLIACWVDDGALDN